MLVRFSSENVLSLRTRQELSLVARTAIKDIEQETMVSVEGTDLVLLPVAAVYGANASGKTNVFKSLAYMRHAVLSSQRRWAPDEGIARDEFKFEPSSQKRPSRFEIDLVLEGVRYSYGFELNSKHISREWLHAYPRGRKQMWFDRAGPENSSIEFGKSLLGENRAISQLTRHNSLFLSAAAQNNHKLLSPIFSWFKNDLRFIYPGAQSRLIRESANNAKEALGRKKLLALLKSADLGIVDVDVVDESPPGKAAELLAAMQSAMPELKDIPLNTPMARFELSHQCPDESKGKRLPLSSESEGTTALLALSGPLAVALARGGVIGLDELGSNLHPVLCLQLIRLFLSKEQNPHGAQLIFNTHDTNILGSKLLRRDEIWFTEKDDYGATQLYPLTDFSPRGSENLESGYLQGRYGAIPYIGSLKVPWDGDVV